MRLLVIRASAMGDVALTIPVLKGMRNEYPDVELLLLTRESFAPLFKSVEGLDLFFPDFEKEHKGFSGLYRLFKDIRKHGRINYVIDLHDVLRSKIIRVLFMISGVKTAVINKGRKEKRAVIKGKIRTPVKHSVERYRDVFSDAGYDIKISAGPWIIPSEKGISKVLEVIGPDDMIKIGVAPFAKHKLKVWPEEKMKRLLKLISEKYRASFWFFGGREEKKNLESYQSEIPGSFIVAGNLSLDEELALMSRLDFMIAMDSSNMHMAALSGIKVISIWGGTDPVSGFGAWMQPLINSIRIPADELTCRPCTIFGKGNCRRGDFACMNWLTSEMVFEKIGKVLSSIDHHPEIKKNL